MNRLPMLLISLLVIPTFAAGQEQEKPLESDSLQSLSWFAGSWISIHQGIETEEHWMAPKSGLMLGSNRTVRPNGKTSFEFMRLVQEGDTITFLASPGGKEPIPFVLKEISETKAVFENVDHDFPQRIIYERDQDQLHSRIEGTLNGVERSVEWHWQKLEQSTSQEATKSDRKRPPNCGP